MPGPKKRVRNEDEQSFKRKKVEKSENVSEEKVRNEDEQSFKRKKAKKSESVSEERVVRNEDEQSFIRKKAKKSKSVSEERAGNEDEQSFKRKKAKKSESVSEDVNIQMQVEEDENTINGELLDIQTIREGMLLLGCVTEVKPAFFVMSLPGCLSGVVPASNISNAFTKSLEEHSQNLNVEEPSISSIIKVGMVFPCKVIQIAQDLSRKKPSITLSINPQDINADLKPSSLYAKMVLYVSICSVEDHGYVVDIGNKYIQGFLPKTGSNDVSRQVTIGEVIPTYLKKINVSSKKSAKIQLSELNFNENFPEASVEDIKLSSILPGAKIKADVIDVKHPFVLMKYLRFDACANVLSLGSTYKAINIGSEVQGTVLYTHPITKVIYIMLNMKPSPDIFSEYFGLKKYESVQNLKFQYFYKNRAYYRISKGTYGYINIKDLPSTSSQSVNNLISKARILFFHYMDNLVQMTAKPSMTEKNIVLPEDVKIGDIYEAFVRKHTHDGMIVWICPGLFGFVRCIQMSDVFVTKPEILHPVGSKIKCRVLSTDGTSKLNLTCKESLLQLQDKYILSSYDRIQKGQFYKGVVVKTCDEYILVLFFNDVKGIIPSSNIPKGSVYFDGQTVLCEVLSCHPMERKLKLSLKTEKCSAQQLSDLLDAPVKKSTDTNKIKVETKKNTTASQTIITNPSNGVSISKAILPGETCNGVSVDACDSKSLHEAQILKVKGSQLNIIVNDMKGRVHITQLGCKKEGVNPLQKFSAGQKIQVYITGEYTKKKKNYLDISHKNLITFKECALEMPQASSLDNLTVGTAVTGFVKEVSDVSAILWLSPSKTGVLDYLHFCESPKVARKLRRNLKIGQSFEVYVLNNHEDFNKGKRPRIELSKIERIVPEVGSNILGLVQIACMDRGLVLKLPFGYHGVVAATDLTDKYASLHTLLDGFRKSKFVLGHILDVNHQAKYCQLSLRKSRVFGKKTNLSDSHCLEITPETIVEGETIKGFVKSVSDTAITVVLGRNLEGRVHTHNCTATDCELCNFTKSLILKYPAGSVIEVVLGKISGDGRSYVLNLTDSISLKNTKCNRLSVTEDISWDDVE